MSKENQINDRFITEDGSITCRDQDSGELYHNRAGAYSEALHHYVQVCDLNKRLQTQNAISILDVCFGLGYNTFIFLDKLIELIEQENFKNKAIICSVTGIDKDPQILDVVKEVLHDFRLTRFCQAFNLESPVVEDMLKVWKGSGKYRLEFKGTTQLKIEIEIIIDDLRLLIPRLVDDNAHYDYIFHDGFSPRSMPELWTTDLFAQYARLINHDGRIITYSAATAIRGGFKECGLSIRKSAPLGGKSGGTVAFNPQSPEIVDGSSILHLSDNENKRLESRSAIPYRDPDLKSTRSQILLRRQTEISQSDLPAIEYSHD